MKKEKALIILFLACLAQSTIAGPMGTAFTYQGQLYDANYPANDSYDFSFKLYDANSDGNQIGTDANLADVDVVDGYFTVELDFGSDVFNGNARWLEVEVRPSDSNDPNGYTTLVPRQEVTLTPYALYAETAGNSGGDNLGNHVATQNVNLNGYWLSGDGDGEGLYILDNGNVGIAETDPHQKLSVAGIIESNTGGFKFPDGSVQNKAASSIFRTYDSGWFAVTMGNEYIKTHNLGTTKVIMSVYGATDSSGSGCSEINKSFWDRYETGGGGTYFGGGLTNLTTTQVTFKLFPARILVAGGNTTTPTYARIIMLALE